MFSVLSQVHQFIVVEALPAAFGLDLNHPLKAVDSDGAGHRMTWHHMPGLEYQTHDFQARGANQRLRAKLCLWLCAERSNDLAGLCMLECHGFDLVVGFFRLVREDGGVQRLEEGGSFVETVSAGGWR